MEKMEKAPRDGFLSLRRSLCVWRGSLRELQSLRAVTFCGMMAALAVALSFVASIDLGPYVRIGFSGLPNQVVAFLFGPAVGAVFGAVLDIVKFLAKPSGMYFPGFTVSAALGGLIYGAFLYRRPVALSRVFLAQLLVKIFVNIGLNTLWLKLLYDRAVLAILPGRVLSNAVMLPIDTALLIAVLKAVERLILPYFRAGRNDVTNENDVTDFSVRGDGKVSDQDKAPGESSAPGDGDGAP